MCLSVDYIKPLWDHICGCFRGLVIDDRTTHVPFLAVDLDRHTGIPTSDFLLLVETVSDIFEEVCEGFRDSGEVNPKNGSSKLFAWKKDCTVIEIELARRMAAEIHAKIVEATGKNIEVFAHNCKNLRLPLHPEKLTIIDSGLLGKATRRRGREKKRVETHSVAEYVRWLLNGENYNRDVFLRAVADSCKNLPDEPTKVAAEPKADLDAESDPSVGNFEVESSPQQAEEACPRPPRSARRSAGSGRRPDHLRKSSPPSIEALRGDPNSWTRQFDTLLIACRRARKVLTPDEALDFIRQHRLFTGDWEENEARRASRVADILKIIAKTFDPTKCGSGNAFQIDLSKFMDWSRKQFASPVRWKTKHGSLKETGVVKRYARYTGFTAEDAGSWLAINEFCRTTSQYGDGGVPEDRAGKVWRILHADGQIGTRWDVKKWRLIRDVLVQLGVISCDYVWERRKAYCYGEGKWYPGRTVVWEWFTKTGLPGTWRDIVHNKEKEREEEGLNSEGVYGTLKKTLFGAEMVPRGPP